MAMTPPTDLGTRIDRYRCCLPALAGFLSPHSMGPGANNKAGEPIWFKKEVAIKTK